MNDKILKILAENGFVVLETATNADGSTWYRFNDENTVNNASLLTFFEERQIRTDAPQAAINAIKELRVRSPGMRLGLAKAIVDNFRQVNNIKY